MKKSYLVFAALVLTLMGLIFTLAPNRYLAGFGATLSDPSLLNIIRSFGGFYLGFAAFLLLSSRKAKLMDGAILSVALVMTGFLAGRTISLFTDGLPNPKLWISLVIELIFAAWGFGFILKKKENLL
ncbi:MAG: DUF4345 domain-containing protein [Chloroflexi bacterium]|nr:DUF4345 domain-containing protein [Chloroflexota bacterium]